VERTNTIAATLKACEQQQQQQQGHMSGRSKQAWFLFLLVPLGLMLR
jgi:hypothetical protein